MTEGIGAAEFATAEARPASERETERQYVRAELDRLWARGRNVLGCDLAIMGGAMTWVSLPVGTLRSHRLCIPLSSVTLRTYLPSGEIAACAALPEFVICVMVKC